MTCIVGLVAGDRVYLGGDSGSGFLESMQTVATAKVFRRGAFLIGFTDSWRMGQLLQYAFRPPPITGRLDAYMVTTFVDALRTCFKAGGFARTQEEVESAGTFLVGVRGRLFTIYSNYQVLEVAAGYDVVGCGTPYALGALFATPTLRPKRRVRLALQAATALTGGVRPPFTILRIPAGRGGQ